MKICIIGNGKFRHTRPYLEYFRSVGHEVHYISLNHEESANSMDYCVDDRSYSFLGKLSLLISAVKARKLIKGIDPEYIMGQFATSGGVAALIASQGVPYMVCAHGSDVLGKSKRSLWRPILKKVLGRAFLVNSVSDEINEAIIDLGVPVENCLVAPLGIDIQKFEAVKKVKKEARCVRLLCTRSFEPVYDNSVILNALADLLELNEARPHLTFAGGGSLINEMKELSVRLNIDKSVTFLGAVTSDQIAKLLAESDIYISSSLRDGTSLSLMEAFAAQIYPVVSNIRANTTLLNDPLNGSLFKVGDAQDLANCLSQVINDNTHTDSVVLERNLELVHNEFNRSVTMRKVEEAVELRLDTK